MNSIYEQISEERKLSQEWGLTPAWYSTGGYQLFNSKYKYKVGSVREQFSRIAQTAANHLPKEEYLNGVWMFFHMLWEGILSPATPILSNMGTTRGFPISCAGNYTGDSVDSFYKSKHETAMLTKYGFGTSSYLGDVRPRGSPFKGNGKASGVVPLIDSFVNDMTLVSQGSNRRGAFAAYLPIEHSDFDELCDRLLNKPDDLNIGWNISDSFIENLNRGDLEALRRYQKALKVKCVSGKGYFWFIDKANRKLPQRYKEDDLENKASNLCSEILLPSNEELTYSCVLSSLNLVHWDKIKKNIGTDSCYIKWATKFLNCVIDEFLLQAKGVSGFEKIVRFTEKYRAIGLGVCGYHTYLMQKGIAWDSLKAGWENMDIFKALHENAYDDRYENTSRIAVAPTKSTALLMGGISEGINPVPAFTFTQATAAGDVDRIDPIFLSLMKERKVDIENEIKGVTKAFGSVQHVSWLTDEEKEVFKTAFELNQKSVVRHASQRAQYVDQWQSVNLFFSADEKEEVISEVHKEAFNNENIVGLYYLYSLAGVPAQNGECSSCM